MTAAVSVLAGRSIDQVGILVPSIEDAVSAHRSMWRGMDWSVWSYGAGTGGSHTYRGHPCQASWRAALNNAAPQVELIEPLEGPSLYHEWIAEHGHGLHHLGVVVPSLADAIGQMSAAGFEPVQFGSGFGLDDDGGYAYFDTTVQLGFMVEAIVRPLRRRKPDAVHLA